MEKRILNRDELLKVLKIMLEKLSLSLIAALIMSFVIWYMVPVNSLWFTYIIIPVLAFIFFITIFYLLGKALFLDFYHQEKIIEHKTVQKPSTGFSKQMETPTVARCTQKQSFGVSTENSAQKNEVLVDNEKLILPKELFERLRSGDEITLHKAFHS